MRLPIPPLSLRRDYIKAGKALIVPDSRPMIVLGLLVLALLLAGAGALQLGPLNVSIQALWSALGDPSSTHHDANAVIQLRLPRILLAALVGAVLAVAGCCMQALFRNPLAEPGLVGLSSGAALGAALMLVAGSYWPALEALPANLRIPLAAFSGAADRIDRQARQQQCGDPRLPIHQAQLYGNPGGERGAGLGLLSVMASDTALRGLTFWLFGSLGKADWAAIQLASPALLLPLLALPWLGWRLNALLLGEAPARHLGVDVALFKKLLLAIVVLAVGAAVSLTGIIGFVGLIVPHLIRLVIGPDHRMLLPASALSGALLLLAADSLARSALPPAEIPVGVITALIGGPFFLALLLRNRDQVELG